MIEFERQRRLARWVAREVMPYEPHVRAWLARSLVAQENVDDLIQEAYCRLAELPCTEHIERPGAFFFQTVRNLLINHIKRARVVHIDLVADLEIFGAEDDAPSPEQVANDRREWGRVSRIIDTLPERCRRIFRMRKLEGLSQKEIAAHLGVTENVVENEGANGLRLILQALRNEGEFVVSDYSFRRRGGRKA